MIESYVDARDWLEGFIPQVYGKEDLGLVRIENLLNKLGNPQKKFKSIHVGGTSGKGSTAYYIARLLQVLEKSDVSESWKNRMYQKVGKSDKSENLDIRDSDGSEFSGLKIGLHVSPHLVDIRERMQIFQTQNSCLAGRQAKRKTQKVGDNLILTGRFVGLANEIKTVVDDIIAKQPHLTPSYFEILVAMSFLYFAQEKVDWAIVEVGLGGRLDATNVLSPEISVITNVGLDHTDILGDAVEQIAAEKAGIIKGENSNQRIAFSKGGGSALVVTAARGEALKVIEKVAKGKNTPLIKIYTQYGKLDPKIESYLSHKGLYDLFSHNLYSAKSECMILAIMALFELGVDIDKVVVKRVLENQFPGRFEEISSGVILDGAHNPDKIKALIEFIRKAKGKRQKAKVVLVIAFKKGKNWQEMVDLLMKNLPIKDVITTEYQAVTDTGRGSAVDAEEIAGYLTKAKRLTTNVKVIRNSQEAVFYVLNAKRFSANSLVLVTGSLYLVGEVRTLWELPEF